MKITITHGYWRVIWGMQLRQVRIILVRCLGRHKPEGGVVLGIHLDYDRLCDFYIFYILSCNIILPCICSYLCMHPLLIAVKCRYLRITIGNSVSV